MTTYRHARNALISGTEEQKPILTFRAPGRNRLIYTIRLFISTISEQFHPSFQTDLTSKSSSAKVALWNHKIYISMTKGCPLHVELSKASEEVETAIHGIDACLQHVADQDMLSFLPIST